MGGSNGKSNNDFVQEGKHPALSLNKGKISTGAFGPSAVFVQAMLILCFWPTDYDFTAQTVFSATIQYTVLSSVMTLLLVGMGFTYAYLQAYGLSAVGFSFFMTALGMQWGLLVRGWITQHTLALSFSLLDFTQASAGVLACLISFGALAGKISPLQTLVLTLMEVVCYFANQIWILGGLDVNDNSTISVCVFAATFGLAASFVHGPARDAVAKAGVASNYHSEIFGFLGALFLWLNWPNLVSAFLAKGSAAERCALMNCIFALLGSTVVAFAATTMPTKRLYPFLALASLAGGVAIGDVANVQVRPGGAILIGAAAGGLACWCFKSPFGNTVPFDTFNIHAIFGVPGLFGGLLSVIMPFLVPSCYFSWSSQLMGLIGTWLFAVASGGLAGYLLKLLWPPAVAYTDETYWDSADDLPRPNLSAY
mmetsp:Transcript_6350/g.15827  ORF Transcript_6350/g.15827 Transcript_6350/m.15827 type:complete len:424 (-) Transcript_6350:271-1542(-)